MRIIAALLAGAAILVHGPAGAQSARPLTQPTRDVTVTYTVTHGSGHTQEQSSWQAASGLQRVGAPGTTSYMLADRRGGVVDMVNDAARRVMEMKLPTTPIDDAGATYARLGQQTIAGLPCTNWQVSSPARPTALPTIVCLTDDGVTLGMRTGESQFARATAVRYGSVDPAAFVLPSGYQKSVAQSVR